VQTGNRSTALPSIYLIHTAKKQQKMKANLSGALCGILLVNACQVALAPSTIAALL